MKGKRFNIRVYGICEFQDAYLVTDEIVKGIRMTKNVGGGLERGEGIRDALIREFQEECGALITETSHFYTTEHFQESAFCTDDQLISIYYKVNLDSPGQINVVDTPFEGIAGGQQCFRWVGKTELCSADVTFPIDKLVVQRLLKGRS